MGYFFVFTLIASCYADSISSAIQSSRQKRDDESEPWMNRYLPDTIEPIQYDLFLLPYFSSNGTSFHGNVSIDINVLNQTKVFIVHQKDLTLKDWRVREMNGTEIGVTEHFDWAENDYHVMRTRNFVIGRVKLTYEFDGKMTLVADSDFKRSGLYNMPYVEDGEKRWLVLSDFGQNKARCVFPNFDEPRFKARFRISILHWPSYNALSNMPVEMYDTSSEVTVFKLSPKMSSHQVVLAVTKFSYKNTTIDGKQFFVWAQSDRLKNANYTLAVTPIIQQYLQTELNLPYSLEKLDQLAVPDYLSTPLWDNWGLTIYTESELLFDETMERFSVRNKALIRIAYSQAFNYFGNLVTCRYWNHTWLGGVLAKFYEIRAFTEVDQTVPYKELFFGERIEKTMSYDTQNAIQPLIPASDSTNVFNESFQAYSVLKGVAMMRMVENFVGAEAFQRGIRQYLANNAYGTVVTDDLWNALQQETGDSVDLRRNMMNWVQERGLPLITVKLLPGNRINATQKIFPDTNVTSRSQEQMWYVPLTYRIKGGTQQLIWMNDVSVVFDIPELATDDWIEFNYDRIGYYRVNYDEDLWDRLAKQLNENHTVFTELSRSKLVGDAKALVSAEEVGYDVFFKLTKYASKERDLTPWLQISPFLLELDRIYNTTLISLHQKYVTNLTMNLMDTLQVKFEGTAVEEQLRAVIMLLSCSSGYKGCVDNTTRMFQAWIQDETTNPFPEYFRSTAYCIGVAYSGDESEWNTVFERYQGLPQSDEDEKRALLDSLSCSRNTNLLERLLDFCMNTTTIGNDTARLGIIYSVVGNPYSENHAWNWLKRKFAVIDQLNGRAFAELALMFAVRNINTRIQYQEVLEFYNAFPDVREEIRNLIRDQIDSNIRWMDKNFDAITTWLETNAGA